MVIEQSKSSDRLVTAPQSSRLTTQAVCTLWMDRVVRQLILILVDAFVVAGSLPPWALHKGMVTIGKPSFFGSSNGFGGHFTNVAPDGDQHTAMPLMASSSASLSRTLDCL